LNGEEKDKKVCKDREKERHVFFFFCGCGKIREEENIRKEIKEKEHTKSIITQD
jgi:hypothetical protein